LVRISPKERSGQGRRRSDTSSMGKSRIGAMVQGKHPESMALFFILLNFPA